MGTECEGGRGGEGVAAEHCTTHVPPSPGRHAGGSAIAPLNSGGLKEVFSVWVSSLRGRTWKTAFREGERGGGGHRSRQIDGPTCARYHCRTCMGYGPLLCEHLPMPGSKTLCRFLRVHVCSRRGRSTRGRGTHSSWQLTTAARPDCRSDFGCGAVYGPAPDAPPHCCPPPSSERCVSRH